MLGVGWECGWGCGWVWELEWEWGVGYGCGCEFECKLGRGCRCVGVGVGGCGCERSSVAVPRMDVSVYLFLAQSNKIPTSFFPCSQRVPAGQWVPRAAFDKALLAAGMTDKSLLGAVGALLPSTKVLNHAVYR